MQMPGLALYSGFSQCKKTAVLAAKEVSMELYATWL